LIDIYEQLTDQPICYGANFGSYAAFFTKRAGLIKAIKLQHVSGFLTCSLRRIPSYWGCECCFKPDTILTIIVEPYVRTLFPVYNTKPEQTKYFIPGYNHLSLEIVLPAPNGTAQSVKRGYQMGVVHSDSIITTDALDNSGTHCVHVFALYA